jgi:hypothetical protein
LLSLARIACPTGCRNNAFLTMRNDSRMEASLHLAAR